MWKLIYFALISSIFCHDVYRFNREFIKPKPALKNVNVNVITCKDGQSQCDDNQTCCQLPDQSYGCCPEPLAVCCSDHKHCCPHSTVCNLNSGTCDSLAGNAEIKIVSTLKSKVSSLRKNSRVCPDGISQCDDKQTCCLLSDNTYGCCPDLNAVCCSDHIHCCPYNTLCNISAGTCDSKKNIIVSMLKTKIPAVKSKSVICPSGKSECEDNFTCCALLHGSFGCCPDLDAVCCSDGVHCCPHDTVCNLSAGTCDRDTNTVVSLLRSKVPASQQKDIICPDGTSRCDSGTTCCKLADGSFGCCPIPNATCCSDKIHCCPHDTVCNFDTNTCDKKNTVVSELKRKLPAVKVKSVICPGGQSQCDDGYTCCVLPSGDFGCCSGVNSVCCQDKIHCCPEHTTCNMNKGSCDSYKNHFVSSLIAKVPSVRIKHTACPDTTPCDDRNTCCQLVDGSYGCCLYTNAVCCSDHYHCCPNGTTCNLNSKTCDNDFFPFKSHSHILRP